MLTEAKESRSKSDRKMGTPGILLDGFFTSFVIQLKLLNYFQMNRFRYARDVTREILFRDYVNYISPFVDFIRKNVYLFHIPGFLGNHPFKPKRRGGIL